MNRLQYTYSWQYANNTDSEAKGIITTTKQLQTTRWQARNIIVIKQHCLQ